MPPVTPSSILRGCGLMAGLWGPGPEASNGPVRISVVRKRMADPRSPPHFRRKQPANRSRLGTGSGTIDACMAPGTVDVDPQLAGARAGEREADTTGRRAKTR